MMSGHGKSDSLIVPRKPPNKAQATEAVEGRRLAKGNLLEQTILRTQSHVGMHIALEWVRKADCYLLALSLSPEARAECGNSACSDLGGGRWATSVPTATPRFFC